MVAGVVGAVEGETGWMSRVVIEMDPAFGVNLTAFDLETIRTAEGQTVSVLSTVSNLREIGDDLL